MEEDLASNLGFISGNRQRERIVQVLGSKGAMPAEKVAKFERIPLPSVKKILEEMAQRGIVADNGGIWSLTEAGAALEKELKRRA